jgi:Anti-sigma factor NepR
MSFFGNNEWDRVVNIEHLRTLWAARPSQHRSGVIGSREQARAEIRRRLREHYEAATSQAIPDRLAQLVEKIEQSESRSELGGGSIPVSKPLQMAQEDQKKIAAAIVEHLESSSWRIERAPSAEATWAVNLGLSTSGARPCVSCKIDQSDRKVTC